MSKPFNRDINILTEQVDISEFISTTKRDIVVETGANLAFDPMNPDPTKPFPGKDGKWYRINFPNGLYNCYMFALGWTIEVGNKVGYGLPGILYGYLPQTREDCVNFMLEDLRALGRDVHDIYYGKIPKKLPKAEDGTYWVKIYFTKEDDGIGSYHVSRKDEKSGRWLHKLGWFSPCKVVCNNMKFGDAYSLVLSRNPKFRERLKNVPEGIVRSMLSSMGFDINSKYVTESRIENRDNAPYRAYNPEENESEFVVYRPFAALRIDE